MADYISREAAKEAFENADADVCESYPDGACDWGFGMKNIQEVIDGIPAADVRLVRNGRWIYSRKHLWYKDKNGEIDMWRLDIGFHNGPECQVCHASFCEHCTPNFDDEECDVGHYYCSECKAAQFDNHNTYCPNCGSKMDLEE